MIQLRRGRSLLDPERIHKQYEVRTLFMFLFLLLSDFQQESLANANVKRATAVHV